MLISFRGKDALRPKILLNGHVDVVPAEGTEQFELRVEGNRAYGRGTMDMKGMVAVLLEVMLELGAADNPPDVALLLSGDEEVGGKNGAGYCVQEFGLRPQFVLCADGAQEDRMQFTVKEKGVLWVQITAQGKTAHGAHPWEGENAIEKLFGAIGKIQEFVGEIDPEAWKSTVNVGIVETENKTPNKVPAQARAVLDIRFTEELAKTPQELLVAIQKLTPDVEVQATEMASMLFSQENNPFFIAFKKAAEKIVGQEIKTGFGHGSTDARYFAEVGIPTVVFGAIGQGMHATEEWVSLESLVQNKRILLDFLKDIDNISDF